MKQICDPIELQKAFIAANVFQFVADIQGELRKQPDGVILPVCEIIFSPLAQSADITAVNAVFATQLARDWRAWITGEPARLAAVDTAIVQDNIIQQIKVMTPAEYDAWWAANVTTAAQAIAVLKRVVRVICRRLL